MYTCHNGNKMLVNLLSPRIRVDRLFEGYTARISLRVRDKNYGDICVLVVQWTGGLRLQITPDPVKGPSVSTQWCIRKNIRTTSFAHYPFGVADGVGIPPAAS